MAKYLINHLTDFDEICMAMHISCSDPIRDQKFVNLKIWKSKVVDRGYLKNLKNVISSMSNFDKILHQWCRFGRHTLGLT